MIGEKWIQKPVKGDVDVVVMVSQQKNLKISKSKMGKLLMRLQDFLKLSNHKTRYSLIGFGGDGISERAHMQPLSTGDNIFGNSFELARHMENMEYKGHSKSSNDVYEAIMMASNLRFRPSASKVFIMFSSRSYRSHRFGAEYNEALYDIMHKANAALYVVDDFEFKHLSYPTGEVIGQTNSKLYSRRHVNGFFYEPKNSPESEIEIMAHQTNGGVFSKDLLVDNTLDKSLKDAVINWLETDNALCKECRLEATWTGVPKPICHSRKYMRC